MPYSVDLRERVVGSVDNGMHIDIAATTFQVSRRVIYKWLELRRNTGKLKAKTGYQKGHSHKITDWEQFEKFTDEHKQYAAPKMIHEWHRLTQIKLSESCLYRALARLDYTSKKNF